MLEEINPQRPTIVVTKTYIVIIATDTSRSRAPQTSEKINSNGELNTLIEGGYGN